MIRVKVVNDQVVRFPYSLEDLRLEHLNVSFPVNPPEELLNAYGVYTVKYYPYPKYDVRTQIVKAVNTPILIDGVWSIKHEVINKTEEEIASLSESELKSLRAKILNEIDVKTNDFIMYGFVHNGFKVRLTIEDQINFEGEFNSIKDYMSNNYPESTFFPVTYKVWTDDDGLPIFMLLNNLDELRTFLSAGKRYIRDCLAEGWTVKNAIIGMTLDELKVWKDPRIVE